jgi:dipeptidyl aminopeptidase/acylaminoacyl peptidase
MIFHGVSMRYFRLAIRLLAFAPLAFGPLALSPSRLSSQGRRPLAIEDYYRIKTVGGVSLSPDGKFVAFTVSTRLEENNGNAVEAWLVPWDGSTPAKRISADGASVTGLSWDGAGMLRFNAAGSAWVVMNPAVPEATKYTAPAGEVASGRGGGGRGGRGGAAPAAEVASPDGNSYFAVRDVPPPTRTATVQTEFEKRHADRFKGIQFDWLDYQRDGGAYPLPNVADPYVSPPQEIFVGRGGAAATQLTRMGLRPTAAQWSADGKQILFTADSLYRSEQSYGRSEAWLVTVADGKLTRLTPDKRYDYRGARYSPDGKWILLTRQLTTDHVIANKLDHGGATDLVVMPASGGTEKNLTESWDYLPAGAQWSPDSRAIYFTGGVGGTVHLFRVSPEGGAVGAMTSGERRIEGLSMDRAMEHIAYSVGTFDQPSEIWSATIDGKSERQLTRIHEPFTSTLALGKTERQQFKSADGTPIEGWLTLPANYSASGAKTPLILSNHGGPHSAIQYGFNFKNQYFAANGYAVLEINFRSSTGYGEKFLWGTWGAWGTKDGQDVMAGVDYVLARYNLDRARVASIGHSYGGFMTNWLITQYPDRFAAAASGAGIVNWTSDYGNADIARTKETEFYGTPWEERARNIMIKQSPLTYAGKAKTPTLFINGEIDRRVPFTENEQLYVALKKNGVPAKMIQYADQPHGIAGHWNNVHRMLNEKGWFDKYMKATAQP